MKKIALIADLHHFSETLADDGTAYRLRQSSDQKCLKESGAIIDSAFRKIAESDFDYVFIAGDISNDGEKVSHREMKEKIEKLNKTKPVFLVYSTHDWCCDGRSRRYEGEKIFYDVETMGVTDLREFYKEFGEAQAYDTYINELGAASYAVKLDGKIRLIGLNDDRNGKGKAGYCDEHLEWITNQAKDAKANGETVIVMEHHLLLPNISMLINGGQLIGDWEERAEALADAGVDFVIVGHSHMQRNTEFTSENGNKLIQINVGALCGHPSPIVSLTVDDDKYSMSIDTIDTFTYKGETYDSSYTKKHTENVLMGILDAAIDDKEEFFLRVNSIDEKFNLNEKFYKPIRAGVKFLKKLTVGRAAGIINFLTFGKGINRKAVKQIKKDNLLEYVMKIYLGVFDGSKCNYAEDDPVYIIVQDVASLPRRISNVLKIKALRKEKTQKLFAQIEDIAKELTHPSLPDNQQFEIPGN